MSAAVRIPTILRNYTQGQAEVMVEGGTVREVLSNLDVRYPGITARVIDDQGNVRRFVNVYLDDDDVRFLDGLDTPVSTDAQLSIIPAVAGG